MKTAQVRYIVDGKFHKLLEMVREQFEEKHFKPYDNQVCEAIASAAFDEGLFDPKKKK